jgi:predicted Zn finger-like uncharacterized protein
MIKVECESCKASYELDERRIPPGGMKMRCPKCGTSFKVGASGSEEQAGTPAETGGGAPPAPPASISDRMQRVKKTLMGSGEPPSAAPAIPAGIAPPIKRGEGTMVGMGTPAADGGGSQELPEPAAAPAPETDRTGAGVQPPGPAQKTGRGGTLVSAAAPVIGQSGSEAQAPLQFALKPAGEVGEADALLADLPSPAASPASKPTAQQPAAPRGLGFGAQQPPPGAAERKPTSPDEIEDPSMSFADIMPPDIPEPEAGGAEKQPAAQAHDPELSFADLPLPDLPVPKAKAPVQRPAGKTLVGRPKEDESSFADLELPDLPAPKGQRDLPAAKKSDDESSFADLALPDLPAPKGEQDLPAAKKSDDESSFADLALPDLPAPKGERDLPAAKKSDDESSFADLALPDLPAPKGDAGAGDLPLPKQIEEGFGELELPLPKEDAEVVTPKRGTVQGIGAAPPPPPPPAGSPAAPPPPPAPEAIQEELPPSLLSDEASEEMAFGPLPGEAEAAAREEPPLPPPPFPDEPAGDEQGGYEGDGTAERKAAFDSLGRTGIGGSSFGEVELGSGGGEEIGGGEDEMEFGMEDSAAAMDDGELDEGDMALPPDILRRQRGAEFEAKQQAAVRRTLMLVVKIAVALAVFTVAGLGMGWTEHGIFGIYFFEQYLPSAGSLEFARDAIADAEKAAMDDTYRGSRLALKKLGAARRDKGLNRLLLTRSLMHESFFLVRFGQHTENAGRAGSIYKRLEERSFVAPGIEIAFAADALRKGELDRASGQLGAAQAKAPKDPYVKLIAGELELHRNQVDKAEKAFQAALTLGGGARAQWGLTRVLLRRDDPDAQIAAIEETLEMSPRHIDARIAKARILVQRGEETQALGLLREAVGLAPVDNEFLWSYKMAKAEGYSVIGYLHETRGRLHLARKAYDMALKADPYRVEALLGAGAVSLREHRFNDALARFESAINTTKVNNPTVFSGRKANVEAVFGISRAFFSLGKLQEAKQKLATLAKDLPEDAEILLWLGKAEEKLKRIEEAEQLYRKAIEIKPNDFEGYLALAQLYFNQGKNEEAIRVLNDAASNVPESAEMHRLRGKSELASKRLDNAIHHFKRALELDPEDLEARFLMASAFRRNGRLHEAKITLDQVASRDAAFAGLEIEWGLYYEAQGDYGKAVESYRTALERDPSSTELLLRLGAAQVENGEIEAAGETLEKVIRQVPNSAEAEYFIGRIAMAQGRTPDALIHFDRAIGLDPGQAEFHIYAGKAALEMKNIGRVNEEAQKAIDIDASLGEAWLLRGLVRLRAGTVKYALRDFNRALELKPSLHEAYAYMGECYDQLRELDDAVRSYQKALERERDNGEWWFKLGRLLHNGGRVSEAGSAFVNATRIGDEATEEPYWLAEAHRTLGDILAMRNNRRAAIVHYNRFLEMAPEGSVDIEPVKKKLKKWGIDLDKEDEDY